jgi:apolipoprotein N-acyltransferase
MPTTSRGLLLPIALATVSALLYSWAAIPTAAGAMIAWVAIVPLFMALEKVTAGRAFCIGWVFGLSNMLALAAVMWPVPGIRAQHLLVPAGFLALYPALWAAAVVVARNSLRSTLAQDGVALAAWLVLDHVRANIAILAFPLGSLAQTQVENLPLIQIAAVLGEAAVTFLVLLGNLAIWRLLRGDAPRCWVLRTAPVVATLVFGSVVLTRHPRVPELASVPMAVLHTNFPSFGSARVSEERRDRDTLESLVQLAPIGAHVLVTPETSFVNPSVKPWLQQALQLLADQRQVSLVVGAAQAAKFEAARTAIDAAEPRIRAGVWIFRPGAVAPERYDKFLRVPFSEYLPLSDHVTWPKWLVGVPMQVAQGPGARVYELPARDGAGIRFGAMVCWEGLFAAHARQLTRAGAQVLFQVANEGWFPNTGAGARHNAAVRLRAVENGRWVLIASNAGPSEIIDAQGRVLAHRSAMQGQAWVAHDVEPRTGRTIYSRLGDVLVHACGLACAWAAAVAWSRNSFTPLAREVR